MMIDADRVRMLAARVDQLANAACSDRETLLSEFSMRIPAEPDRDADLVLKEVSGLLIELLEACQSLDNELMESGIQLSAKEFQLECRS